MYTLTQYRYANDINDQIVHILDIVDQSTVRSQSFACPSCGNTLIPVLGKVRQKHFRHKVEVTCNQETYLHKSAKMLFYQTYQNCLSQKTPFFISLPTEQICIRYKNDFSLVCELSSKYEDYDLTKWYKTIRLETRDDAFIPDLLLIASDGDRVYVEKAMSHPASNEKRQSEFKIIEMHIRQEADLASIQRQRLSSDEIIVEYINFSPKPKRTSFCQTLCQKHKARPWDSCPLKYAYFIVYDDGKSIIIEGRPTQIQKKVNQPNIIYSTIVSKRDGRTFLTAIKQAYRAGIPVKNCFICAYQRRNQDTRDSSKNPVYCFRLKKNYPSNQAATCQFFKPDLTGEIKRKQKRKYAEKKRLAERTSLPIETRSADELRALEKAFEREVATCSLCDERTNDWVSFDGKTKTCKCRACMKRT